ncbi:hypothetical protein pb186bvf_021216 [Paramecium bursaria]
MQWSYVIEQCNRIINANNIQQMAEIFIPLQLLDIFSDVSKFQRSSDMLQQLRVDQPTNSLDFYQGPFKKIIYFEGQEITSQQYLNVISNQQVLKVERCAQSLTGAFPSGLFSALTIPLVGIAVRHEYALIHTNRFILSLEIEKKGCAAIVIRIFEVQNQNKQQINQKICENRWYSRNLDEALPGNSTLYLIQVDKFINLQIQCLRFYGNGQNDFTQKNCKSFARSILSFSREQLDMVELFESMVGVFGDLFTSIFLRIHSQLQLNSEESQRFIEIIRNMRIQF